MLFNGEASTCSQTNAAKHPADIVIHLRRFMRGRIGRSHLQRQSGNGFRQRIRVQFAAVFPQFATAGILLRIAHLQHLSTSANCGPTCLGKTPHNDGLPALSPRKSLLVSPCAIGHCVVKSAVKISVERQAGSDLHGVNRRPFTIRFGYLEISWLVAHDI